MKKVIIDKIDNYVYELKDYNNETYILNMEFQDVDFKISIGDIIYINKYFINNSNLYTFGFINNIYGKDIDELDDMEIIVLVHDNKKYYLKRIYG